MKAADKGSEMLRHQSARRLAADDAVDGGAMTYRNKLDTLTLEEIESAILNAPPAPARKATDPADARRKREEFKRSLDELEARFGDDDTAKAQGTRDTKAQDIGDAVRRRAG